MDVTFRRANHNVKSKALPAQNKVNKVKDPRKDSAGVSNAFPEL